LEKLVDLAQRNEVKLRQSYRRVAKRAAIMVGRYSHAHQFKHAGRALKTIARPFFTADVLGIGAGRPAFGRGFHMENRLTRNAPRSFSVKSVSVRSRGNDVQLPTC